MSEEEESSTDLLHSLVTINDIPSLATLFLTLCDSKENAIKLLESIILEIDPIQEIKKKRPLVYDEDVIEQFTDEHSTKIPRPEDEKLSEIVENNIVDLYKNQVNVHDNNIERLDITFTDVIRDIYDDDASNESYLMTLAVLIPNDMGLSAYIIGKQGANVAEIRRKTKAKTQLEQPKLIPPGITERNIFFMGTVRGICEAYQHVFARIISKADTLPAGCLDDLRMVIPTELSALLIGKGGVSIKKIQSESGARTHLQSEDEMVQSGHYYGRILVISGTLRQRCHAMYLILKNLLMQRDFPDDWRGGLPPLISLGSPVPLASSLSQPSLQNARLPLGTNMNGQAHLGQYNPTHMMHSPHHIPLHPQFNPNYIPDLSNVTISGPLPKWTHVQNMQQSARGPQITPYAYPSPPTNMMYPPMHQGGLIAYPTQPSIVHMQSIPLHQQHHGTRMNNHPRGGGRENGRGGGY